MFLTPRRAGAVAVIAVLALAAAACGAPGGSTTPAGQPSSIPAKPKSPVTLNILDVAGNLQLTQGMLDGFAKAHPDIVSHINTSTASAPELAGKIKAQQNAGRLSLDMVLTGTDGLSAGISQKLWVKMTPTYNAQLSASMDNYLPAAADMQKLAQGQGVELVYYPSGPLLEYNPKTVPNPPKTAAELLSWAQAHPGKFQYAQPANSGPGRTFLMGMPYVLGDKNPKDPTNGWAKTWSYLEKLGKTVSYYPAGTTDTMKNLADGSADIVASTTGWDINPRALGTVPKGMKVTTLQGFHWVSDAQYAVVPKGISADKMSAVLALLKWMLTPKEQAIAYDSGYFYPGPAVKGVTLSMAPPESQAVIKKYGRAEYAKLIANNPTETSLPAKQQVAAFDKWDRMVGGSKVKK